MAGCKSNAMLGDTNIQSNKTLKQELKYITCKCHETILSLRHKKGWCHAQSFTWLNSTFQFCVICKRVANSLSLNEL